MRASMHGQCFQVPAIGLARMALVCLAARLTSRVHPHNGKRPVESTGRLPFTATASWDQKRRSART